MANGIDIGKAYVRIEPTSKGIGNEISKVLNDEAGGAGEKAGSKLASGLGSAFKAGAVAIGTGIAAATGAVVKFGQEAVSSYANYEQLVGGVEKLYGDAAGKVEQLANEAYKTSGMSANQYMETATSFSAALINSLEGDVDNAAKLTDVAMRSISDNVNTFGSNMESVTNAFQGFAKGQFNMLDNLKLGYGGTKEEMERLLRDAEKYEGFIEGSMSVDNFADIISAIDIVQEHLNIAGTTNREAMSTIEGSATATKAAWENVITAIGRGEGIDEAFDALLTSIFGGEDGGGLLNNILPRIQTVMEGIGQFIVKAAPILAEQIPAIINQVLPSLLSAGATLLEGLLTGILSALPELMPVAMDVINQLINFLIANLPMIFDCAIQILLAIVNGIADNLDTLIPAAVDAILTIVEALIDHIDLLVDAAIKLTIGLAEGLIKALPRLIEKAPVIIGKLVTALANAGNKLLELGGKLMNLFIQGLQNIGQKLANVGRNLVEGLKNGIINAWNNMVAKVKDMANNLVDAIKGVFKISSPSKVFEQIGDYCVQGFDESFDSFGKDAMSSVEGAVSDLASMEIPAFSTDMSVRGSYQSVDNASNVYGLLAQYLPELLDRNTNVNVSLEGDAQGLFRQVRQQTNQFIKSTGASPFVSPA